jgi:hypothetical protein
MDTGIEAVTWSTRTECNLIAVRRLAGEGQVLFNELDHNTAPGQFGDHLAEVIEVSSQPVHRVNHAMSKLLLSVMGAFSEFERALIKERQREGIAIAKQKGVYKGRKPSLTPEQVATLRKRVKVGEKRAGLAREFGISRETLYQYARVSTHGTQRLLSRKQAKMP